MSKMDVVLGSFFGDEGKGRIVDNLSEGLDVAVRITGGNNAGHTVIANGQTLKLHLIPSGTFRGNVKGVIANGVVVDPKALVDEIELMEKNGIPASNLLISDKAHIIMPYHIKLDGIYESIKRNPLGTTNRGIGPCYMDKAERCGIRFEDYISPDFVEMAMHNFRNKNKIIEANGHEPFSEEKMLELIRKLQEYIVKLKPLVGDTVNYLHNALKQDKKVIGEGAQATLLDLDHGTYPNVTSSSPTTGGILTGTGLNHKNIGTVVGVAKAHASRVGSGVFLTRMTDPIQEEEYRRKNGEFGTSTGRARSVGWLDTPALNYACQVNGFDEIALNHLDSIGMLEVIKICVGYKYNGELITEYNPSERFLKQCEPVYEEQDGFGDISNIKDWDKLPSNAKEFVERIEKITGVPVTMVGVGPDREQLIDCRGRAKTMH